MENKSKHTPGPWIAKPIKDGFHDGKTFIFGPQLDKSEYRPAPVVALIEKPCKDKDEHAANMALIAAAPELLAALENAEASIELVRCLDAGQAIDTEADNMLDSLQNRIRAAIAKARGEK